MKSIIKSIHIFWNNHTPRLFWLCGAGLIILTLSLTLLSTQFEDTSGLKNKPTIILVGIMVLSGFFYALIALKSEILFSNSKTIMYMFLVGLIMRVTMLPSVPMLEDDFYRYLWDGSVAAHGHNPFAYAPQDVLNAIGNEKTNVLPDIVNLGEQSNGVLKNINHQELRTIYPPIAQFFFAIAYKLSPWSLMTWRLVLGFCDIVILILLILIARRMHLPFMVLIIYWWNPLWIKEFYNSAHMDIILVPFILGALLLAMKRRPLLSTVLIALACGVKVWPFLLLPVIWRSLIKKPLLLIASSLIFIIICTGFFLPIYTTGLDSESGFTAYSSRWEMNDAFFMMIGWFCKKAVLLFNGSVKLGLTLARVITVAGLGFFILWINRQEPAQESDMVLRSAWIIAALFVISPTQFPWYYGWLIPFLIFLRSPALILLSIMLGLYYLRFHFSVRDQVDLFDKGIVWLEFVPVWCLLFWEINIRKRAVSSAKK